MELLGQMTRRGKELRQAALTGGAALVFTRCAAGSGETAPDAAALDAERQALAMGAPRCTDKGYILPVTLAAALAETDYTLTEVGVYAQDGEAETLYCVYRMDTPLAVSRNSAMTVRFELEDVSEDTPNLSVSPAGLVTEPDLNALLGAPGGIATLDADAIVPVAQMPYTCGTEDLEAGVSPLADGKLYFVYE